MGPLAILMSIAVLASTAASLQSTFVAPARTLLAMGYYGAVPPKFASVCPRSQTPRYATICAGLAAGLFYVTMRSLSENVLADTITALGIGLMMLSRMRAPAYFLGATLRQQATLPLQE